MTVRRGGRRVAGRGAAATGGACWPFGTRMIALPKRTPSEKGSSERRSPEEWFGPVPSTSTASRVKVHPEMGGETPQLQTP